MMKTKKWKKIKQRERERERGIGVRFGEVEEDRIDIRPEIQGCRTLLNSFYWVSHILLVFNPNITSQSEPLPLLQSFFLYHCFFLSLSLSFSATHHTQQSQLSIALQQRQLHTAPASPRRRTSKRAQNTHKIKQGGCKSTIFISLQLKSHWKLDLMLPQNTHTPPYPAKNIK